MFLFLFVFVICSDVKCESGKWGMTASDIGNKCRTTFSLVCLRRLTHNNNNCDASPAHSMWHFFYKYLTFGDTFFPFTILKNETFRSKEKEIFIKMKWKWTIMNKSSSNDVVKRVVFKQNKTWRITMRYLGAI